MAALCGGVAFAAGVAAAGSVFRAMLVIGGTVALSVIALTAWRPVWAVYLYLATLPFLAGIDRGHLVPLVRANEAVLVLVLTGALLGGYLRLLGGRRLTWNHHRLSAPLLCFLLASTVWPLTWLALRGDAPGGSDVSAVLPVPKLLALFVLVRLTVTSHERVLRCLRLVVWPAAGLGLIALAQALKVGPVRAALGTYWTSGTTGAERGTATLASSIATGDYVTIAIVVLLFATARGLIGRREALTLAVPLVAGVLATGQFSAWIALALALVLAAWRSPVVRAWSIRVLPAAVVAVVFLGSPLLAGRFSEIGGDGPSGGSALPSSWVVRLDNLTTFYLPRLEGLGAVFGVGPNSVLVPPETWRKVIYLEGGYLQFLWVGGLPLLAAFVWLSIVVLWTCRRIEDDPGPRGAAGSALWTTWVVVLVLTVLDAHVTLRGTGDLVFLLMALVVGATDETDRARGEGTGSLGGGGVPDGRRRPGRPRPGRPGDPAPADRGHDPADEPRPGRVPAGASGEGRAPVHDVQVPVDAPGRR